MTLEEAERIHMAWGKFLEVGQGRLLIFFTGKIPESFLPYPKKDIEQALNIAIEHFENENNDEAVNIIKGSAPFLIFYVDDKTAIDQMLKRMVDPSYYKLILKSLGRKQTKRA